jgi:hypothetical protein
MKDNSIIRAGERPRKVVSLTINRDLDLNSMSLDMITWFMIGHDGVVWFM